MCSQAKLFSKLNIYHRSASCHKIHIWAEAAQNDSQQKGHQPTNSVTLRELLGRREAYLWTGILVQLAFLDAKMSEEIPGQEIHHSFILQNYSANAFWRRLLHQNGNFVLLA